MSANNHRFFSETTLLLDFQIGPCGESILLTRSALPLIGPGTVIAAFNKSAFEIPGGRSVCTALLLSLEKRFNNKFQYASALKTDFANKRTTPRDTCWAFVVSNLASTSEFHGAIDLFLGIALKLTALSGRLSGSQCDPTEGEN
jgi:hypothetical protein